MSDRLAELLATVERRWRRLAWLRGWTLGATAAALVLLAGLAALLVVAPGGLGHVAAVLVSLLIAGGVLVRALWPRSDPTPRQIARLIEERVGTLDDVIATAVEYAGRPDASPEVARLLAADAARAAGAVDVDRVVPRARLASATRRAAAATAGLAAAAVLFAGPVHRAASVATAYLFPARLAIAVEPGSVRVPAGESLTIVARLVGVAEGLAPAFLVDGGDGEQAVRMAPGQAPNEFRLTLNALRGSFRYRVTAGGASSPAYTVTVIYPPRVERIDLRYEYPRALGLAPREDPDSGDIYAPAGTRVHVSVTADKPIAAGALVLDNGTVVPLASGSTALDASLVVSADGSYRVALTDTDGLRSSGDTEYFIRLLTDRPPDVRIMRPAGDRQVTPLEEVSVEVRADDDFGVATLDLVVQTPDGRERVVPLAREGGGQTVTGRHTIYLEDLGVEPGDVVAYHARARDAGRGRRGIEARSDIFFLEVKPFEEVFRAAQSQAMTAAGGGGNSVDDLVQVQKEIIVATWKLDSRGRRAGDARSAQDIRTVARAQSDLKARAEQMAGAGAAGGDRRRRGARPQPGAAPGDDAMARAVDAMGRAVVELDRLQTSSALPHEMEALNQLLRAQAEVRERVVARQQQGGGRGGGRPQPDLSSLFDIELRRQETNYEAPLSAEMREDTPADDPLEALRELARRQDALGRQQRDLARHRDQMTPEEVRRQLERLTRDQNELRRQAEELEQRLRQRGGELQAGQDGRRPSQRAQEPTAGGDRAGSGTSPAGSRAAGGGGDLREAVEEMREAAGDLRREKPDQAAARAAQALERLRRAETEMRASRPDDRRRALGDLQLETQQLADAQRRLAGEAARSAPGAVGEDTRRRLAGEQARLAERAGRLDEAVRRLAAGDAEGGDERQAVAEAARELQRQRVVDRMREATAALLRGSGAAVSGPEPEVAPGAPAPGEEAARRGEEAARALDRVAERLGAAAGVQDAEARQLSEQLARTRELRERLEAAQRALERLDREARDLAEGGDRQAGQSGQSGPEGQSAARRNGGAGPGGTAEGDRARALERLREEAERLVREVQELAGALRDGGWGGGTPEEWRPSLSAPGTQAFKQDFTRWETLKAHLLASIEQIESQASERLHTRETRDRLHAGRHEAVPDAYRDQVDRYYRSLASPRKPQQ